MLLGLEQMLRLFFRSKFKIKIFSQFKKNGQLHIKESGADIISLQETKCPELPPEIEALDDYCFKKLLKSTKNGGQAGVALISKEMPIKV
jgi:exonuclease III